MGSLLMVIARAITAISPLDIPAGLNAAFDQIWFFEGKE